MPSVQRKLILRITGSPSENVLMTAVVRDLHLCHPGCFAIDVRSLYPMVWEHNPYLVPLREDDPSTEVLELTEITSRLSADGTQHALHCFTIYLNSLLNLNVKLTALKGDIHLSEEEKSWTSQVAELVGKSVPYWIVVSGGSNEITTKLWEAERYQAVIDSFRDRIQFVQVGGGRHYHPKLHGVIDFRGRTDLRQLIRLVYHAQGVLCPATLLMHLAAAVELDAQARNRACVVLAGGSQAVHKYCYPQHQIIHVVGALLCAGSGGCLRSRVFPLRDNTLHDSSNQLCIDVVNQLPRCMDLIKPEEVVRRIEFYFQTDALHYLVSSESYAAKKEISFAEAENWDEVVLEVQMFKKACEKFICNIPTYPNRFRERGIIICAGGTRLFACAWVCIRMLRRLGCSLPIQIWHLGKGEIDKQMQQLVAPYGVECVDAMEVRKEFPVRRLFGWEVKPYAILNCSFKEVLFLDADNIPVVNPEFLFEIPQFERAGALFWPDFGRLKRSRPIWNICGIPYRDEPEFESGQIVVDKEKCWRALCLAMWYNEHSDFYYKHVHGDKETFHMAFRKLGQLFEMPTRPVQALYATLCQHDFEGRRIFQHRNGDKWSLTHKNRTIADFWYEQECKEYLNELDELWHGPRIRVPKFSASSATNKLRGIARQLLNTYFDYRRVGFDSRSMSFLPDGTIGVGAGRCESFWDLIQEEDESHLLISSGDSVTCRLRRQKNGVWTGKWLNFERMQVELMPHTAPKSTRKVRNRSVIAPISPRKTLLFRAPLTGYTGYGLHATQIVTDLQRMGYHFNIRAVTIEEVFAQIPENVRHSIVSEEPVGIWELLLHPPGFQPVQGRKTVYFTMWESSRLHKHGVRALNQAECVLVPTQWNATCFSASGVERPIRIVPLGINNHAFRYHPMDMDGPCIFGTAGRFESGGTRKGINRVIELFQKAFPKARDVRLKVKVFPDCAVDRIKDPRIEICRQFLTEARLADWFSKITCFVSAARGEGWGLMQQQALAAGRPLISVRFGGVTEFFQEEAGYPLDFQLVQADGFYAGCGCWAEPHDDHLIELMQRVYTNRSEACEKGKQGAKTVSRYTWQASNSCLVKHLKELGILE